MISTSDRVTGFANATYIMLLEYNSREVSENKDVTLLIQIHGPALEIQMGLRLRVSALDILLLLNPWFSAVHLAPTLPHPQEKTFPNHFCIWMLP